MRERERKRESEREGGRESERDVPCEICTAEAVCGREKE